jgi:primosomal protein N' (replication factor Y) (superfamily II helicase)
MTKDTVYAEVAIALPLANTFTYEVPEPLSHYISVGKRVLAPMGPRRITGYVLELSRVKKRDDLRQLIDVLDEKPLFPASMISFFKWIADYYKHPIGQVIECALPSGLTINEQAVLSLTREGENALKNNFLPPPEQDILNCLKQASRRQKDLYAQVSHAPLALTQTLIRRGWIARETRLTTNSAKHRRHCVVSIAPYGAATSQKSKTANRIIEILTATKEMPVSELKKILPAAARWVKPLEADGCITVVEKEICRDPFGSDIEPDTPPVLTEEQDLAVNQVRQSLGKGYAGFLLSGVTGSGKTEVYMQLAAEAIKNGHNVLILVPEIVLISQLERRFRARFGECIAVLHSGLSKGERFDQWVRILDNRAPIAIGARSAVFAPFDRLGLIVVDEEHESSYKQDHALMYHARDLAVKRASLAGCVALLGSATPSIQSYHNVLTHKYTEVKLTRRVMDRPLSRIQIVDLRKLKDMRGIRKFISPELHQAMKNALAQKQQVLLFLNRRGYSNISVCGTCGEAMKCKNCEIALTLHQESNAYRCHYCGFSRASVINCPACGSSHIRNLGLGTEKLEEAAKKLFPEANVVRMDRDTTRKKGAIVKILKDLQHNAIDILVGTQMVAKGHDFPNITLVGIVCADLSLSFPDFRASVRTFQLLAQVAGRAGRGDAPGKVILQTYNPDHFSIMAAQKQDFEAFYTQDIVFRKSLKYPPFSRMVQFKITGKDPALARTHALLLGQAVRELKKDPLYDASLIVLGPIESPLSKVARQYRWQILLKGFSAKSLHGFINRLLNDRPELFHNRQVHVGVDVDPYFLM